MIGVRKFLRLLSCKWSLGGGKPTSPSGVKADADDAWVPRFAEAGKAYGLLIRSEVRVLVIEEVRAKEVNAGIFRPDQDV